MGGEVNEEGRGKNAERDGSPRPQRNQNSLCLFSETWLSLVVWCG